MLSNIKKTVRFVRTPSGPWGKSMIHVLAVMYTHY